MPHLILLRHGQSQWNLENRFTGWVDVDLSPDGEREARDAGEKLKGHTIDVIFTSVLKRAIRTAELVCQTGNIRNVSVIRDQALNERHYGDLQGLNKKETADKFGAEQVHVWRRSYDVRPPNGESLKDTAARVLPYYDANILPMIKEEKNVLVVAHGNSLRALVMQLDALSTQEVLALNIPTGVPIDYELAPDGSVVSKNTL
jgi:2,3-bisphosphoglycerate-dependent phosphoglycerate mutase